MHSNSLQNKIKIFTSQLQWNAQAKILNSKGEKISNTRILLYHGLVKSNPYKYNRRFTTIKDFKAQMEGLKSICQFVSVDDIFCNRIDPKKFNIAITFDDGYRNNFTYAAPILSEMNIPASFFITTVRAVGMHYLWTDFLDITSPYGPSEIQVNDSVFKKKNKGYVYNGESLKEWCRQRGTEAKLNAMHVLKDFSNVLDLKENLDYWELMDEQEIRELSENNLFTIGCHGLFHNDYTKINIENVREEIEKARQYLENNTGKQITQLSYPHSSYNTELIQLIKSLGFPYQLLDHFIPGITPLDFESKIRMGVNPYLSPNNQVRFFKHGRYN